MKSEEGDRAPRLRGVRGATTVVSDAADEIVAATAELLTALLAANEAAPEDIVSLVFTSTPDLVAEFPAAAARSLSIPHVPLLCATEIAVTGSLPHCIRVLMHFYTKLDYADVRPVYLRDARTLRTDPAED